MPKTSWFSLVATLIAFLFLTGGCASASAIAPPPHPCVEVHTSPSPPLCDPGMTDTQCREQTAFIRTQVEKTVVIWTARYNAEGGLYYKAGTGTLISETGLVVTAEHVISGALFVSIGVRRLSDDGKDFVRLRDIPMRIITTSTDKDIAFLSPMYAEPLPESMPIFKERTIVAGEQMWHFGNTSYWQHGPFLQDGVSFKDLRNLRKVDIMSDGGDSGGPLVTTNGEIAGVLVRNDKFGTSPTYFVPIAEALTVLGKQ